eukprot:CAMPEP_0194125652 /NCGR_PEP_ID=MMETSP0150-20130528/59577_1 /TAXON_ID=122233 /ORGANISM="Chaetoceros debilis, Strain MM31A-1" /LENGTH=487 /DNA_ID=CAMNT_0038819469 /DNA_START=870 /DNA_END=2330 /DNA_ORIENTATION=+
MENIQTASDLAMQLLNSSDSRVAAAAKRIFSNALLEEQVYANVAKKTHLEIEETAEKNTHYESSSASSSLADIPSDVKEAASAIGMLVDANRMATPGPSNTSLSASITCIVGTNATTIRSTAPTAMCQSSLALNPQAFEPQMDTAEELLLNPQVSLTSSIRKKPSNQAERLHRSRERNKMHARKTRQRKKEQMKTLETQVDELKSRQMQLKFLIEEKNTANILVELYTKCDDEDESSSGSGSASNPLGLVDQLLKRSSDEIPDASKIPELPALILPGQHSNKRKAQEGGVDVVQEYPDDGIDYKLLSKDRSACSQEELDKIRRERNRMHAKRTRDRKRIFMEAMEAMIKQLAKENMLLQCHLERISDSQSTSGDVTPALRFSPALQSSTPTMDTSGVAMLETETSSCSGVGVGVDILPKAPSPLQVSSTPGSFVPSSATSPVLSMTATTCESSSTSIYSPDIEIEHYNKRQRLSSNSGSGSLLLARW